MRRKQLFALVLAGVITAGSIPATAFAEADAVVETAAFEDGAATPGENGQAPKNEAPAEETPAEEAPTEETPAEETPSAPDPSVPATPTEEPPTEVPPTEVPPTEVPPTEVPPTEVPAQTPAQVPARVPSAENPTDNGAPQGENPDGETPDTDKDTPPVVYPGTAADVPAKTQAELIEAIRLALPGDASAPTKLYVSNGIVLSETVKIENKHIQIIPVDAATIKRDAAFKGGMFSVSGGSLCFAVEEIVQGENKSTGTLTIDGSIADQSKVQGSVIDVLSGGTFAMGEGITITGNLNEGGNGSDGKGGAICIAEGATVNLTGGSITGNAAKLGGGIYNNGTLSVSGKVSVTGNNDMSDSAAACNIFLPANKVVTIAGDITGAVLGITAETPAPALKVVDVTGGWKDGVFTSDAAQWTIGSDGALAAAATPTASPTPTPTATVAPTATPTPVPTQTPPVVLPTVSWKKITWDSHTSVQVDLTSSKPGKFYYVFKEGKLTEGSLYEDELKEGGKTELDGSFYVSAEDLAVDTKITLFVKVVDSDGNSSEIVKLVLDKESTRPPKPVDPTPTHVPVIPPVTDSKVTGLEKPLEFWPGTFYEFRVTGAGTDNDNPGEGDVYWKPLYWSTAKNPSETQKHTTWKIGAANGISDPATYNLYITFRKMVFKDGVWTETNETQTLTTTFKSKAIEITPTGSITPTGEAGFGGGGNGWDDLDDPDSHDDYDDSDTGSTTSEGADTADEAPVGGMASLLAFSLLTGSYIIVRKRKKATEEIK